MTARGPSLDQLSSCWPRWEGQPLPRREEGPGTSVAVGACGSMTTHRGEEQSVNPRIQACMRIVQGNLCWLESGSSQLSPEKTAAARPQAWAGVWGEDGKRSPPHLSGKPREVKSPVAAPLIPPKQPSTHTHTHLPAQPRLGWAVQTAHCVTGDKKFMMIIDDALILPPAFSD